MSVTVTKMIHRRKERNKPKQSQRITKTKKKKKQRKPNKYRSIAVSSSILSTKYFQLPSNLINRKNQFCVHFISKRILHEF